MTLRGPGEANAQDRKYTHRYTVRCRPAGGTAVSVGGERGGPPSQGPPSNGIPLLTLLVLTNDSSNLPRYVRGQYELSSNTLEMHWLMY